VNKVKYIYIYIYIYIYKMSSQTDNHDGGDVFFTRMGSLNPSLGDICISIPGSASHGLSRNVVDKRTGTGTTRTQTWVHRV
jgi:hypothetical protein